MALLTDGRISTLERLEAIDASVVEVARVERVDLDRKICLATEEVELRIKKFLLEFGLASRVSGADGEIDLGRIVATPGLRRWHSLEALAMAYSDAYFSQLNDRYKAKWEHYRDLALDASRLLFDTGVGCVSSGVKRAAAPLVTSGGVNSAQVTYFVSIVWRNASGTTGEPSEPTVFSSNQLIVVQPSDKGQAGWTFDVYAGISTEEMSKQNHSPVAAGDYWAMPTALMAGTKLPSGQAPEFYLRRERIWQRG